MRSSAGLAYNILYLRTKHFCTRLSSMEKDREALLSELKKLEKRSGAGHQDLVPILERLAYANHSSGLYEEAEKNYRRSLSLREEFLEEDEDGLLFVYHSLGMLLRIQNKYDESEFYYKKALALTEEMHGDKHVETATRKNYLAGLFYASGKFGDAEELVHSSLKIYRKHLGEDHKVVGVTMMALGIIMARSGKVDDAKDYYRKANSLISPVKQGAIVADFEDLSDSLLNLSKQKFGQDQLEEAETLFRYSLLAEAEQIWPGHPLVAENVQLLGDLYKAQQMPVEAEFLYRKALEIRRQVFGDSHLDVALSSHSLGALLTDLRKFKEAEEFLALAVKIRSNSGFPPALASSLSVYANCLEKQDRKKEAEEARRKSEKILQDYRPQGIL